MSQASAATNVTPREQEFSSWIAKREQEFSSWIAKHFQDELYDKLLEKLPKFTETQCFREKMEIVVKIWGELKTDRAVKT